VTSDRLTVKGGPQRERKKTRQTLRSLSDELILLTYFSWVGLIREAMSVRIQLVAT